QTGEYKLDSILSNIDNDISNPETDETLYANFYIVDLKGKEFNKKSLQEHFGLHIDPDIPLMGIVTRLDEQKGIQLIIDSSDELLGFRNVQLVLLGTGKPYFEDTFRYYMEKYPENFKGLLEFDVNFAQLIYAGCDLFLMPSAFEPCGLSQLNAMRYGTLPIVHEVEIGRAHV